MKLSIISKNIPRVLLLLIFASSFFFLLRFYKLGQVPNSIYWDEAAIWLDASQIASTGKDIHNQPALQSISLSYGDYKMPGYILLTSVIFKIFGTSEASLRFGSMIAFFISTISIVMIMKNMTRDEKSQKSLWLVISAFFVISTSSWFFHFSRVGFEAFLAQSFLALSVALLLLHKRKPFLLIFAAILGAMATYTYFSVRFVWMPIFILGFVLFLNKEKALNRVIYFLLALCLYMVLIQPIFRSPYYDQSQQFRLSTDSLLNNDYALESNKLRENSGNDILSRLIFHRHLLLIKDLGVNISSHLSADFLFITGDLNLRHSTAKHGMFLISTLPFFLIGLILLWAEKPRYFILFLGWILLGLLPAAVPTEVPHALRSLNAALPLALIISYGLGRFLIYVGRRSALGGSPGILTILIISINFLVYLHHYFYYYPTDSYSAWQGGYREAAEALLAQMSNSDRQYYEGIEHLFYLWLLVYGDFSAEQILQYHDSVNQPDSLGTIFPSLPDSWEKIPADVNTIAVVTKEGDDTLDAFLSVSNISLTQKINGSNSSEPFVLKVLTRP